ncbi:uncharacterized protein LOC113581267 isoform X2 [Electrophorus electricus]|uniref:uncharacterized protein LOC113581267 isoform X2 n=1 Tax=Electrophorus electricus TaxID=8005 RepID=UPI0015CFC9A8|nr:uncharacterized protein LOC113581267 isoform X2 [Electrophorus electricus]
MRGCEERNPINMEMLHIAVLSSLLCSAYSATIKAKDDHRTAFFGEDIHIPVPAMDTTEVVFKPKLDPISEVVFFRNREIQNSRAKLNFQTRHLVLEDVGEEDEGTYVVRNSAAPADVRRIILIVRDCATETTVKYGETYHITLNDITGPYTLEFRRSTSHINQTIEPSAVVLLNHSIIPIEEYRTRLSASEKKVNLHVVTGTDEGSYTVLDSDGKIRKRTCLNVKEHQIFVHLHYDKTLKIKLYINHTKINMVYTPDSDNEARLILDQGELVVPLDPMLDGRVSVDVSMFYLKKVKVSDTGIFRVTDLSGFHIADVYVDVEPYKLPQLYVVILSLLGLLAFLLLVCLISCQIKVRRREARARKIALIAQQAGKGDGETFRQVVHEAYTRFTEESTLQSTWENITESTEVEIKGLEVFTAGHYHTFLAENNFVEMTDSALPLDSDTDVPQTYASHKLLFDSDSLAAAAPANSEGNHSATRTPDSVLSASPATQHKSEAHAESDFLGVTTPHTTPKVCRLGAMEASAPATSPVPETSQDALLLNDKVAKLDQCISADGTTT